MSEVKTLKYFADGEWRESASTKTMDVFNPSTEKVIAKTPCCTKDEVEFAIAAAKKAYETWSKTPVFKRSQVLFKFRDLVQEHLDELTVLWQRNTVRYYPKHREIY